VLSEGVLVEDGHPKEVFDAPKHEATRALLQSASTQQKSAVLAQK